MPGEVEFHEQWSWARSWVCYGELVAVGGGLARVARTHRAIWAEAVERVEDGAVALVVGHGDGIEPGLVAYFPEADHQHWGAAAQPMRRRPSGVTEQAGSQRVATR